MDFKSSAGADSGFTIGELARRAGMTASTLRYYETIGLLAPPSRIGGKRRYRSATLTRLRVIELGKTAGFTLEQIRTLLRDDEAGRPGSRILAQNRLEEIDGEIGRLRRARQIVEWATNCRCPSIDDCSCGIHPPPPD